MKMVWAFLMIMLLVTSNTLGFRDPFDAHAVSLLGDPLKKVFIEDLVFLGRIVSKDSNYGFISDSQNNVYKISLAQKIGLHDDEVVKILNDGILLRRHQHFYFIH